MQCDIACDKKDIASVKNPDGGGLEGGQEAHAAAHAAPAANSTRRAGRHTAAGGAHPPRRARMGRQFWFI